MQEERMPIIAVGGQDRIDGVVHRQLRDANIAPTYVRTMADLRLCSAGGEDPTIAAIMHDKGFVSSTIAVLPFVSGRLVVIGRAIDHWLVWHTAEDIGLVMESSASVEISPAWILKLHNSCALYAYIRAVNDSRDNLRLVADFTRLRHGVLCALGYRTSIARTALAA